MTGEVREETVRVGTGCRTGVTGHAVARQVGRGRYGMASRGGTECPGVVRRRGSRRRDQGSRSGRSRGDRGCTGTGGRGGRLGVAQIGAGVSFHVKRGVGGRGPGKAGLDQSERVWTAMGWVGQACRAWRGWSGPGASERVAAMRVAAARDVGATRADLNRVVGMA